MNLRSCEKKKKEPLRPAPSPALNTMSRLNLGLSDEWKLANYDLKYSLYISLKRSILWYVTHTSYCIRRTFFWVSYDICTSNYLPIYSAFSVTFLWNCWIYSILSGSKLSWPESSFECVFDESSSFCLDHLSKSFILTSLIFTVLLPSFSTVKSSFAAFAFVNSQRPLLQVR